MSGIKGVYNFMIVMTGVGVGGVYRIYQCNTLVDGYFLLFSFSSFPLALVE